VRIASITTPIVEEASSSFFETMGLWIDAGPTMAVYTAELGLPPQTRTEPPGEPGGEPRPRRDWPREPRGVLQGNDAGRPAAVGIASRLAATMRELDSARLLTISVSSGKMKATRAMKVTMSVTASLPDARRTSSQAASSSGALRSPLRLLDSEEVSAAAKAESRNREVHIPPVSTYRWWARRTSAVNGAIIDAFQVDFPGRLLIADIFAGGGVIPLSAVIRGHQVYAQDLNPWSAAGLAGMLGLPDPELLQEAAATLEQWMHTEVESAYGTTLSDGTHGHVAHTFRVATAECTRCGRRAHMFPHALVSLLARKERGESHAWLACRKGHLFTADARDIQRCPDCHAMVDPAENYTTARKVACRCGHVDRLAERAETWRWEVVLVERAGTRRRELARPTTAEIDAADESRWSASRDLGPIEDGQETRVLRRHGFSSWNQLYPARQRVLLTRVLDAASWCSSDPDVVRTVRMAVVGSAEMAGHLSRWDRFYLKSYEAMAGHRFNLTTLAVEPNVWGTVASGRGTVLRRMAQLVKAAEWLKEQTGRQLHVEGPISAIGPIAPMGDWDARVVEGSSECLRLPNSSVHLVLTDPPYHDDVQYSELSAPLRAWARLANGALAGEAVVNAATGQLTDDGAYERLLTRIFTEARRALRPDGHLIFSYANRSPDAWAALFSALQSAGMMAAGCEIVHSENETDHAKRNVRACALDLILDLVPIGTAPLAPHPPAAPIEGAEADFLRIVAVTFLRIGSLEGNWAQDLRAELRQSNFLCTDPNEQDTRLAPP
jgi:putative DNA methylase